MIELAAKGVQQAGAGMQIAGAIIGASAALIPDERRFNQANIASKNLIGPNKRTITTNEWWEAGKAEKAITGIGGAVSAAGSFLTGNAEGFTDMFNKVSSKIPGKPLNKNMPMDIFEEERRRQKMVEAGDMNFKSGIVSFE